MSDNPRCPGCGHRLSWCVCKATKPTMSDHKSQSNDHTELSIDRATLEEIAYRLKHAAGVYLDIAWYGGAVTGTTRDEFHRASNQCMSYADLLLNYARSLNNGKSHGWVSKPTNKEE